MTIPSARAACLVGAMVLATTQAVATPRPAGSTAQVTGSTVTVTVTNIIRQQGVVYIALCREAEFMRPGCFRLTGQPVTGSGRIEVVFQNVPAGVYAAVATHDVNGNQRVDRNVWGAPTEPTGVSGAAPRPGQLPRFTDSSFEVARDSVRVSVQLQ